MYVIVFMNVFVVMFMPNRVRVICRNLLGNLQKVFKKLLGTLLRQL